MSRIVSWAKEAASDAKESLDKKIDKWNQEAKEKKDFKKKIERQEWERYQRDKIKAKYDRKKR